MKTLVAIAAFLVASTSFAVDFETMTWGQILNNSNYRTNDDIVFQNGPGLGATFKESTSPDMCQDGTYIYGGTTNLTLCENDKGNGDCSTYTVKLKTKMNGAKLVCSAKGGKHGDTCVGNIVKVPFYQSATRSVAILAKVGRDSWQVVGKKSYTIPYCSDLVAVPAN